MRSIRTCSLILLLVLLLALASSCDRSVGRPQRSDGESAEPATTEPTTTEPATDLFARTVTVDLNGKEVRLGEIAGEKLTMINFWTTWCGPCIGELPELQKVHENYLEKGVRLIGVVLDAADGSGTHPDVIEEAIALMKDAGAGYIVVVPDDNLLDYSAGFQYVPTTCFFDAQGNLVDQSVGSSDYDGWSDRIDGLLENL